MAKVEYSKSLELEQLGHQVIREYHPELSNTRIAYIFRSKAKKNKGSLTMASISKLGDLVKMLSNYDLILEFAKPVWEKADELQRKAIVDHELCHVGIDEETGEPYLIDHDVHEFAAIVRRYGAYTRGLERFLAHAEVHKKEEEEKGENEQHILDVDSITSE